MKKKIIYISILLFAFAALPIVVKANTTLPNDSTKHKKLHWGAYFSGEYCNWYLKRQANISDYVKEQIDYWDSIVIPSKGFTIGFTVEKHIWQNFYFQTGLLYRDFNLKTLKLYYYDQPWPNILYPFYEKFTAKYITLPVNIKYNFLDTKKISLFCKVGISPCVKLYGERIKIFDDKTFYENIHVINYKESFYIPWLEGNASIGVNFNFNKFKISIAPFISSSIKGGSVEYLTGFPSADEYIYSKGFVLNLIF